ncbi:winged helix-turn-helix transcriptional regulator [Dongia sp.]|uniref:winged helix-turn-helix transcriptional regulator n=1 Tax=Dongia sp. TaxID=1977262 RepID=UPI0035B075DE
MKPRSIKPGGASVFLAGRAVRLFKRGDRPTRFWQAAFRRPGRARPLVKSTGQATLEAARSWALSYLAALNPPVPEKPAAQRDNLLGAYPFPKIRQEKRHVERELALRVLAAYRADPLLSQRRLALALDVSLAVVNAYTARAEKTGWLAKLDRPEGRGSGYRYVLTTAGRAQLGALQGAYLAEQMRLYRHLRQSFAAYLTQYEGAGIVLFGAGEMAEIARSVLADHGIAPLAQIEGDDVEPLTRHAVKRHRRHAVLWLAVPGDTEAYRDIAARHLPGMKVLAPALI